jgi:hypothetical protein
MKPMLPLITLLPAMACGTPCDEVPAAGFGDVGASPAAEIAFTLNEGLSKHPASFALWLESEDGAVHSVFASCKAAHRDWFGGSERPEALPAWFAARALEEQAGGAVEVDSISGATPVGAFSAWTPRLDGWAEGPLALLIEVNVSFDDNEAWTDEVDGQPALVWGADLSASGGSEGPIALELLGRSELDGSIDPDLEGMETALELLSDGTVQWHGD